MRSKRNRHRYRFLERFWAIRDMRYTRLNAKTKSNAKPADPSGSPDRRTSGRRKSLAGSDAGDIPLQCLNAQLLLTATERRERRRQQQLLQQQQAAVSSNASPTSSSLDLEWEHEAGASQRAAWIATADESEAEATSQSTGSGGASSDSSAASSSRRQLVPPSQVQKAHSTIISRLFRGGAADPQSATATDAVPAASHAAGQCRSRANSWSTHRSTPDSLEWDVNADEPTTSQQQLFALRTSDEDLLDTDTMELLQEIEWLENQALSETGVTFRDSAALLEAES